ncbi:Nucleolar complex protein 4 [Phlyctochytrium planicorne]|nr:Nucleolar complex protein 4 [Phlyctochytrium planicorne]
MVAKRKRAGPEEQIKDTKQQKLDSIKQVAENALEKKTGLASLPQLFEELNASDNEVIHASLVALCQIFATLLERGDANATADKVTEVQKELVTWIRTQLDAFVEKLLAFLLHEEPSITIAAYESLISLIKHESIYLSNTQRQHSFQNKLYLTVTGVFVSTPISLVLQDKLLEGLNDYDDLRLNFLRNLKKSLAEREDGKAETEQIFNVLSKLRRVDDEDDLSGTLLVADEEAFTAECKARSPALHKRAFSEAWLEFLRVQLNPTLLKRVLLSLHRRVIPHLNDPTMLIDFLTDTYNGGGALSLLALNGLFTLITEYNLDYPDFYKKLYALLDDDILHVKYRSRFFRLLELFLSSSYIPSYLVASFLKKLSRLALTAPLGGALVVLPFIYNVFKRHPGCVVLIHRMDVSGLATDTFNIKEEDPAKSGAMESSLWELKAIFHHYSPAISGLSTLFEKPLSKPQFDLEDFLDQTYATVAEKDAEKLDGVKPTFASMFVEPASFAVIDLE